MSLGGGAIEGGLHSDGEAFGVCRSVLEEVGREQPGCRREQGVKWTHTLCESHKKAWKNREAPM